MIYVEIIEEGIMYRISTDDVEYEIVKDSAVGDWLVVSESDHYLKQRYIKTKEGAIMFVFSEISLIDDPSYHESSERVS